MGETKRRVLIFREFFLSLRSYQSIIEDKLLLHNIRVFKQHPTSYVLKATSNNVIPAKAGIHKLLILLDPRLRGSDKLEIITGSLNLLSSELKTPNYPFYFQH